MQSDLDRLLALVCRELGADEARVTEPDDDDRADGADAAGPPDAQGERHELRCRMTDGRGIAVRFGSAPADAEAKQRRLEMLVSTFDTVVEEARLPRKSRGGVVRSLPDELAALGVRASAVNAIVIDANSPVVWGAAQPQGVIFLRPRVSSAAAGEEEREPEPAAALISRRALHAVRSLPELAALRKGKHLRHIEHGSEPRLIAHSFASIYLLVLVFDGPFDELRAERAILEALPRIERLVLALPPLDPSPQAGVFALRRPRRR